MDDIYIVYMEGICKKYSFLICSIPYHPSPCETEKTLTWIYGGRHSKTTLCRPCKNEETCDGTKPTEAEISTEVTTQHPVGISKLRLRILEHPGVPDEDER